MELTPALTAQLAALTTTLDDPDVDFETTVHALGDSVAATVDSFLGVSLTVIVDDYPFTVTTVNTTTPPVPVGASLRLPVPAAAGGEVSAGEVAGATVVFYAATPGAFVDLAADITYARRRPQDAVALDNDLQPPAPGLGLAGLSVIHQAVGVLIARGDTPQDARAELERRAASSGVDVHIAAEDVVASTAPWPPSRP